MIRLSVLMIALSLAACGAAVPDPWTPCYPKTSPNITGEDGQVWVCASANTWTPADRATVARMDAEASETRKVKAFFLTLLGLIFARVSVSVITHVVRQARG